MPKTEYPAIVYFTGPTDMTPEYASDHAAGADLKANLSSPVVIAPGERALIPTGLHMAIPEGWEGQVRPRSGLALKKGLAVLNSPGTIDSDYRGEVKVILINLGNDEASIGHGERIAQLVIAPAPQARFEMAGELPVSRRGHGGFGSTGS